MVQSRKISIAISEDEIHVLLIIFMRFGDFSKEYKNWFMSLPDDLPEIPPMYVVCEDNLTKGAYEFLSDYFTLHSLACQNTRECAISGTLPKLMTKMELALKED